jgi:hypothetical protein
MGRLVREVDHPVVEAVHELAGAAVEGEEPRRVLAAEGLDLPGELLGRDLGVPRVSSDSRCRSSSSRWLADLHPTALRCSRMPDTSSPT